MTTAPRPGRSRWRADRCGSGPCAGQGGVREQTVARGAIRSFGSRYVHDVANASAGPAITVHAYSPPLTAMRRYELTGSGLVHIATEHAERDW